MSTKTSTNLFAILAVVAVVAGAAWLKAQRAQPTTETNLPRLVDVGAHQCQACKDLAPILAELRKEYAGRVAVEFVDVWKNPEAGKPYGIRLIPTQILYDRDGREVWRHEGFVSKADLVALFGDKVGVR